ncbi:MAG: sulfate reduction electron transfer complex DsrMKJOP subunit DsrJ [Nitrospirae bacterium]|nr:sulfate reduction electron transfer complex DsrMKJOP subunit DsrJ [Nitrospirota bacterium]
MYDSGKIIVGLIIFIALVTFPFYNNIGKVNAKPELKIDTPEIQKLPEQERKCVEPKEFMRGGHMQLLNDWRDSVVRNGNRVYKNSVSKEFNMSLQNECMRCHSNKKDFCDKCHNYMAVKPYCWDCHIAPKEKKL